jgi:hypothetical protein
MGPIKQGNAKKILSYYMRNSTLLQGKKPSEIQKLLSGKKTLLMFKKKGMYITTTNPFTGRSVRDTVPRPTGIELPKKEVPADVKKLWTSADEALRDIVYKIAQEPTVRGSLVRDPDTAKRILAQLRLLKPKTRFERRAKTNLIKLFKPTLTKRQREKNEGKVRALNGRSRSSTIKHSYKMLVEVIKSDIDNEAPKIFNDFFIKNKKREKALGIKLTFKGGNVSGIEIEDYSKLDTLDKELKKHFRLAYKGR